MKCADLAWDERGTRPLSAEEAAHVAGCDSCQRDAAFHSALRAPAGTPAADLAERIRTQAHAALQVQPRPRPWFITWGLAAVLAVVAGVPGFFLRRRVDWSHLSPGVIAAVVGLLLVAFVIAGRAAFAPGLAPRGRIPAVIAFLAAQLALLALPGPLEGLKGGNAVCLGGIVAISALPLILLWRWLRRRTRDASAGILAGIAAGALGEIAFFLHCPYTSTMHLAVMHLGAWVAIAAVGAGLVVAFPERLVPGNRR